MNMNKSNLIRASIALIVAALGAANLSADVVETKSGARIVGKVSKIDGGSVVVSTDYAGAITIKQSEVTSITTDAPVAVRLASGTRIDGKVSTNAGAVQIAGVDGAISTTVDKVAASWAAGGKDPAVAALERGWAYEAAVDVAGKTGNKEQLGTGFSFRATLAGSQDTLQFYSAYDRQVSDGVKSADQFKVGVDYANNFSGAKSWYVRNEGGFDRVKDIELYDVAAFGLGYDIIKAPKQTLTGRAGVSFRYAGYKNPRTTDVKSAGLDFGFNHRLQMDNSVLVNRVSYVPTFEDFSVFVLTHESSLELPLLSTQWKLRLGVANDYNSSPGRGVKRLDTTYFTRLVLNWK
jgi:putative salt-induced outer membrane protein YdiY